MKCCNTTTRQLDAQIIPSLEIGATGEQFAYSIRCSMYNVLNVRQLHIIAGLGKKIEKYRLQIRISQ